MYYTRDIEILIENSLRTQENLEQNGDTGTLPVFFGNLISTLERIYIDLTSTDIPADEWIDDLYNTTMPETTRGIALELLGFREFNDHPPHEVVKNTSFQ